MKKVLVLVAAFALFAAPAIAAVSGTKHDMNVFSGKTGDSTEICVYCHTPHGANMSVLKAPLWNRGVAEATGNTYAGLDLEVTTTLAEVNATDAPLCLSCHDGASLTATLTNPPNVGTTTIVNNLTGNANIGTDLSNDHPIGFNYVTVQTSDLEIQLKANAEGITGMTGALSYGAGNDMWCSSCHDVHDNTNGTFLRVNNAGSNLCLACHIK